MMTSIDERFVHLTDHVWRGGAFAYYWTNPGKQSDWFEVGNLQPVPNGTQRNTYFGVHPVTADNPREPGTRSRIAHIAAINCVFAEFDAKDFNGSQTAVDAHVAALPLTPSVVIFSGGGSHCYWLLRETLIIDGDRTREWACNLQAAWVKFVGSDDGAKDLARVLRVPGTRNYKPGYKPDFPKVEFVKADFNLVYDLADFDDLLDEAGEKSQPRSALRATTNSTGGKGQSAYAQAAFDNEIDRVRRALEGTRNSELNKAAFALGQFVGSGELSRSDVENALLDAALSAGLPNGEARATISSGLEAGIKVPRSTPPRSNGQRPATNILPVEEKTSTPAGPGQMLSGDGESESSENFSPISEILECLGRQEAGDAEYLRSVILGASCMTVLRGGGTCGRGTTGPLTKGGMFLGWYIPTWHHSINTPRLSKSGKVTRIWPPN